MLKAIVRIEAMDDDRTAFEFYIDPGSATPDEIGDVLSALSGLHIALGGNGFQYEVKETKLYQDGTCSEAFNLDPDS